MVAVFIFVGFFILLIFVCSNSDLDSGCQYMSEKEFYNKVDKLSLSASNCSTSSAAKNKLEELESLMDSIDNPQTGQYHKNYLRKEISTVREEYESLLYEEWEKKADKILDEFFYYYFYIIDNEIPIEDFQKISSIKSKCLRLYSDYFALEAQPFFPKRKMEYAQEFGRFASDNDDFVLGSKFEIEKQLDDAINKMKPEIVRVKKIYDDLRAYVRENDCIKRVDLLNHFNASTNKEVNIIYKDLVRKYKLVEKKIGKYYYVSLPDKDRK